MTSVLHQLYWLVVQQLADFKVATLVRHHIVCNSVMLHRPQYSYAVFIYHMHLPLTLLHSHLSK